MSDPRVTVGGDAAAGFIVDVHDGDRHGVYSPEAATAAEAQAKALQAHATAAPTFPASSLEATIAAVKAEFRTLLAEAHARIDTLEQQLGIRAAAKVPSIANDQGTAPSA